MVHLTVLNHWGRVTHICVSELTIIGSDNGLSPGRRQAIIWTNAGILLIGPLGTNCSEILIAILTSSFKKMRLKVSSAKWRPFCLGLNVLKRTWPYYTHNILTGEHSLSPGRFGWHLDMYFLILFYWLTALDLLMFSDECNITLLIISQHWFRYWLGAVRQQAITWVNVEPDLCGHMVSLDHNELTNSALLVYQHYRCV